MLSQLLYSGGNKKLTGWEVQWQSIGGSETAAVALPHRAVRWLIAFWKLQRQEVNLLQKSLLAPRECSAASALSRGLGQTNPANDPENPSTLSPIWPHLPLPSHLCLHLRSCLKTPDTMDRGRPKYASLRTFRFFGFECSTFSDEDSYFFKSKFKYQVKWFAHLFLLTSNHYLASSTEPYFTFCWGSSE